MKRISLIIVTTLTLALLVFAQSRTPQLGTVKKVEVTAQTIASQPTGKPFVLDLTRRGTIYNLAAGIDYSRLRVRTAGGDLGVSDTVKKMGSISGKLSYPSEFVPPMRVCAISVDGGSHFGCVTTSENQRTYRILNLHQATYYVVAYVKEAGVKATGAFTRAVRCGAGQPRCTDGSLIPVTLGEGNSITGIDPGDFYSSSDTWPKEPAQDHD